MHGQAGTVPLEMRTDWRELPYIYRIVLLSMVHASSMVILIAIAIPSLHGIFTPQILSYYIFWLEQSLDTVGFKCHT